MASRRQVAVATIQQRLQLTVRGSEGGSRSEEERRSKACWLLVLRDRDAGGLVVVAVVVVVVGDETPEAPVQSRPR